MSKVEKFNPLVSIVIPVYNGEKYVKEAIDSALAQTYKNIEIIVVNDGSTDKTEEICKSYGNKIRYFSKKNGGTSTALNVGIKNMKGDYFSWLSHDDQYYPNKIKRQIEELSKLDDKNTIMMTDLDGIDENYQKIYETHYINHINEYPKRRESMIHPIIYNQTHGCTLLFPKKCFDEVGLFDEESFVAQDFEFFYRAFLKFPHVLIPEILVTARDSSNRQGRRSKVKGSVEYSDLFIKIINNLTEEEYKLLAPTKLDFFEDMLDFFFAAGYNKAYEFVSKKLLKNLQISSYDLIGNKFNGHDLHNYLRVEGISSKQLVQFKESNDSKTYNFNFFSKNSEKELIKNRLFYECDIVHFHLIHNLIDTGYLNYITKLKPSIITFHDPYFLGGHCIHHFDCNKWKNHCFDCPYLDELFPLSSDYSSLNYFIKKESLKDSQISVIVSTDWMKKKVLDSPIWKDKKIYKIPFGIDLEKYKPSNNKRELRKKLDIPENDLVIMFRSVNDSFKGLDLIKKSLNSLKDSRNITVITVDNVGLLTDLNINNLNIKEYGWVKDEQLIELYQVSDLFLMPSRQETFGMMAIEAMACNTFVLSLDCEGSAISEVISSPNIGLCVEEKKYTAEFLKIIKNKKKLDELGIKCGEFVRKKYSKEKYVNSIIEAYKETIESFKETEDSKLVIEQLKKHHVDSEENIEFISNSYEERVSFIRKCFRLLPLEFRKNIKEKITNTKNLKKFIKFNE